MTGKLLIAGAFLFVVVMAIVGYVSTAARSTTEVLPQIALIQGEQHYFATIKYPSTGTLPKLPVKVTLSLDNGPDLVTVTTPEKSNPEKFDIDWDTKKSPDGRHLVMVKAFWGQQMIGQESRQVEILNHH